MTETARAAHYVLPASSQFEKWEATFFNLEFPKNAFHLRKPLFEPLPGTMAEPEIYTRLLTAMGELPAEFPELSEAAKTNRAAFAKAFRGFFGKSELAITRRLFSTTLDPLTEARRGGVSMGEVRVRAKNLSGAGEPAPGGSPLLGEALFEAILSSRSGVDFSVNEYEETWRFIKHEDGLIHLEIPEMLEALGSLDPKQPAAVAYPFVLVAGERRSYNANTIYRDPDWRKTDRDGALKVHPEDAAACGLRDGGWARCESKRGAVQVRVEVSDQLSRGQVTLPHGYGMEHPGSDGKRSRTGAHINELTSAEDRDPIAGTPYHKYVPVRLSPVESMEYSSMEYSSMEYSSRSTGFSLVVLARIETRATIKQQFEGLFGSAPFP